MDRLMIADVWTWSEQTDYMCAWSASHRSSSSRMTWQLGSCFRRRPSWAVHVCWAPCKKHPSFHLSVCVRTTRGERSCAQWLQPAGKLLSDERNRTVCLTRDTCTPASDQFGPTQNARATLLFSVECRVSAWATLAGGSGCWSSSCVELVSEWYRITDVSCKLLLFCLLD